MKPRELRPRLLRWYRRERRDLPWRRTRDPYAIWVSEVMLQQTQVNTVLPYYRRFLDRFPDPASLARACEEEVLALWSGLGYYRRARALRQGARAIMERHDGKVPCDPAALRALPGVGRYTAGAISSIAFDLPEPILDGNVRRVLWRIHAPDVAGRSPAATDRRLWEIAGELARGRNAGELNQALMELGALVCTPRNPGCPRCPARDRCAAHAAGDPAAWPPAHPRPATRRVRVGVAWVTRGGRVLLERPAEGSPLRGTWDLPAVEPGEGRTSAAALRAGLARTHGLDVRLGKSRVRLQHGIMNRRLDLEVLSGSLERGRVAGRPNLCWVDATDLGTIAISGATHKIARALQSPSPFAPVSGEGSGKRSRHANQTPSP